MYRPLKFLLSTILVLAIGLPSLPSSANDSPWQAAVDCYQKNQWQQADDFFSQCFVETSDPARQSLIHLYRGECLMQLGDYPAAQRQFSFVLKYSTSESFAERALFRAGEAAWFSGKYRRCATLAEPIRSTLSPRRHR